MTLCKCSVATLLLLTTSPAACRAAQRSARSPPPPPAAAPKFRLTPLHCKLLYIATVINPALSVIHNEYHSVVPVLKRDTAAAPFRGGGVAPPIYRTLFYFARLKPRLLFVVGACLRALQQTTVLNLVFDPGVGVGAGLNLLALSTSSRWPASFTLGWALSKPGWRLLRAEPPSVRSVPISMRLS